MAKYPELKLSPEQEDALSQFEGDMDVILENVERRIVDGVHSKQFRKYFATSRDMLRSAVKFDGLKPAGD